MRSLRARITILFAISATATLLALFVASYALLENRLVRGLDELLVGHFNHIKARLEPDLGSIDWVTLQARMRELSDYTPEIFYIEINKPGTNLHFRSTNLLGKSLPDVKGQRAFTADLDGVGPMRIQEFLLPPLDVAVATPLHPLYRTMNTFTQISLALVAAMLAVSALIGAGLSHLVVRPIQVISATANRIKSDNLSERIDTARMTDEIAGLATLLNHMFGRLETAFAQIRRFADEASHELKTPLSLIRLYAEKLARDQDIAPKYAEVAMDQLEELDRLRQLIDDLLLLSRAEAGAVPMRLSVQSPRRFLAHFEQDAVALSEHQGCRFEYECLGDQLARFEERWLRQVLLNVLSNALAVSPQGGIVRLRSSIDDDVWRIVIEDQGPGLTGVQREKMFERFVRFDTPRRGTKGAGLGLAICRKLVELHRGSIRAEPATSGSGLRIVIELPTGVSAGAAEVFAEPPPQREIAIHGLNT
jgi:two-component system heavy metal sensor histidine kinase CusS